MFRKLATRPLKRVNFPGGQYFSGGAFGLGVIRSFRNRLNVIGGGLGGHFRFWYFPFALPSGGGGGADGGVAGNEYACGQRNAYGRD